MADITEELVVEQHKETEPRVSETAQKFLDSLEEERLRLEDNFPICSLLISEAIECIIETGRIPGRGYYADVYKQKPIKVSQKVFVPVKQYPKFNFSGKILGPKGNSLRRLQEETQCKIALKGRHSIRDRAKEEEMRNSNDPRHNHLNKDLFIVISTIAPPAECYARVAYALAEIRKYLVPDKNDDVSHEQMRELMEIDPKSVKNLNGTSTQLKRSVFDRKFTGSPSAPKYMSQIREYSYEPHDLEEHEDEAYEYEKRIPKRSVVPTYGYAKARITTATTSSYKRPPASAYSSEIKRVREGPIRSYKSSSYSILKKYK